MREIRLSGLMRGGSWLTHLGQLLPTLPPSAQAVGKCHLSRRIEPSIAGPCRGWLENGLNGASFFEQRSGHCVLQIPGNGYRAITLDIDYSISGTKKDEWGRFIF